VILSGGEPFLNPRILYFIQQLADKLKHITILTNGTLINERIAKELHPYRDKLLMQISLDSPRKECHEIVRGRNSYDKTIRAIKLMRENDIEVAISMVPMKLNIGQLDELISLGESMNVKHLHFPLLDVVGSAKDNNELLVPDFNSLCSFFNDVRRYTLSGKIYNGYTKILSDKIGHPSLIGSRNCGVGCNLYVDHRGNVYPCAALCFDRFSSGNVLDNDICDIYLNSQELWQVRNVCVVLEGKCTECAFQAYCSGGCRARAFHATGKVDGADPYCEFYKRNFQGFLWSRVNQMCSNYQKGGIKT
jgi:radical SAM protein with 4Fe4S-binding SPASM domain